MRTETKQIEIYNFDELSQDIQEKLIEKEIEKQAEFYCEDFLLEDMQEKAKELLQKYFGDKATFIQVYYELNYCQGSGAMIVFDLKYYGLDLKIRHYGHYYHENSFNIDYYSYNNSFLSDKRKEQLREKIYTMNKELGKIGYSLVDYRISTDDAIEILNDNEYLSDGTIY